MRSQELKRSYSAVQGSVPLGSANTLADDKEVVGVVFPLDRQ